MCPICANPPPVKEVPHVSPGLPQFRVLLMIAALALVQFAVVVFLLFGLFYKTIAVSSEPPKISAQEFETLSTAIIVGYHAALNGVPLQQLTNELHQNLKPK
jgi:hypothetical protein